MAQTRYVKVSAGHPNNGIHVALRGERRPPKAQAMCGQTLYNAIWLLNSTKPVTCQECKLEVVRLHKERASKSPSTGARA